VKYALGIVLCAIAVVSGLLATIQRHDSDVEKVILRPSKTVATEKNAYFQLLGLFAAAGADPFQQGKQLVVDYEESLIDTSTTVLADNKISKITVGPAIRCDIVELCVHDVQMAPVKVRDLLKQYAIVIMRYGKLADYDGFYAIVKPAFEEPTVAMHELKNLHQLLLVELTYLHIQGEPARAAEKLQRYLAIARHILTATDNAMMKLVMSTQYGALLRLTSVLSDRRGDTSRLASIVQNQLPFTTAELSMSRAIGRDYSLAKNYLMSLYGDKKIADTRQLQAITRYYDHQLAIDRMSFAALNQFLKSNAEEPDFTTPHDVIDPLLLKQMVVKNYPSYVATVRNNGLLLDLLKLKMRVIREKIDLAKMAELIKEFNNGRSSELPPVQWHAKHKSLSVRGVAEINTALMLKIKG